MKTVVVVAGGPAVVVTVVCACERLDDETPTAIPITMQMPMGTTTNSKKSATDTPTAIPTVLLTVLATRGRETSKTLVITK